jgi:hypothetical protein
MARAGRSISSCIRFVCAAGIWLGLAAGLVGSEGRLEAQAFNAAAVSGQVSTPYGSVAANANVRVCSITSSGSPCSGLVTLYTDANLTYTTPNPISTDQFGNYKAFLPSGLYLIQVTLAGGSSQPTYTYYVAAGAGGALSSPPSYSVQFASTSAGQFSSDPSITINPSTHVLETPELFVPGSGTGLIGIEGAGSQDIVYLTVSNSTGSWTLTLPSAAPTTNGSCLTALTSGVSSWSASCTDTSSAPSYSVQFAGTTAGQFASDQYITISPSAHSLTSPVIDSEYFAGVGLLSNIQATVTAAGSTGSVVIPPSYTGTDAWTNSSNIRVDDRRAINPSNASSYSAQIMPQTTIKASEFGALCNGTNDDTAAIQKAMNVASNVVGITQAPPQLMVDGTVELPQGRCSISQPLVSMNYGSLSGSGSGTWLTTTNWTGGNAAMVNIVQGYPASTYLSQINTSINRSVKNINFVYNGSASAITAVKVYNQTGTPTTPYPNGAGSNPQSYQIPQVTLEGDSVYAMDTGFELDDCGNCVIFDNYIDGVRVGIADIGNNYALNITDNQILQGILTYTPLTGNTSGIYSVSNVRYSCTGGTGPACTGGTIAQNVTTSPQGLIIYGTTVESFNYDGNFVNALQLQIQGSGFDSANTSAMYMGVLKFAQIFNSFFANSSLTTPVVEVAALTASQGAGLANQDGLWFDKNFVYAYSPSTGAGIQFDSGTIARRNAYITEDQFANVADGIKLISPVTYSTIRGNYGVTLSHSLINFDATGSGSFLATSVTDNKESDSSSPIPIYVDTAGGGYVIGYNQSVAQVTGTQFVSAAGCNYSAGLGANCGPITMGIPVPYLDTGYTISGCTVIGGTGINVVGQAATITNGGTFAVYESGAAASGAGGGTVVCEVNHQ